MPRLSVGYDDTQKAEGPAGRRVPGKVHFFKAVTPKLENSLLVFHKNTE